MSCEWPEKCMRETFSDVTGETTGHLLSWLTAGLNVACVCLCGICLCVCVFMFGGWGGDDTNL